LSFKKSKKIGAKSAYSEKAKVHASSRRFEKNGIINNLKNHTLSYLIFSKKTSWENYTSEIE
jgi:hypothetical protein